MFLSAIELTAKNGSQGGFYPLKVIGVELNIRDAVTVTFETPAEWKALFRFKQGQHLTVRARLDGEEVRRSYSICSAVDEPLRIAVKRCHDGLFSNWINDTLQPGCMLEAMPPSGGFHVPLAAENEKHYLGIAAGSGITPILSILKTTLLTEPKSRFTLIYGNRASGSVMFRDELADLKDVFLERLILVHITSREQQDLELLNGRITGEKCNRLLEQWCPIENVDTVFLCGPQSMMLDVSAALQARGIAAGRIKMELFSVADASARPARAVVPGTGASTATLTVDGSEHVFPVQGNETILEAGLKFGLDLRHSCTSGVCGTCRCKLLAGEVDMDVHYALEDYEVARGFILACQSYPVTDRVVVDFDQDA